MGIFLRFYQPQLVLTIHVFVCRGCDNDSVKNCYIEMAKVTKGHNYTGEIIDIQYSKRDIIASYYNATYHCAVISLYNDWLP